MDFFHINAIHFGAKNLNLGSFSLEYIASQKKHCNMKSGTVHVLRLLSAKDLIYAVVVQYKEGRKKRHYMASNICTIRQFVESRCQLWRANFPCGFKLESSGVAEKNKSGGK